MEGREPVAAICSFLNKIGGSGRGGVDSIRQLKRFHSMSCRCSAEYDEWIEVEVEVEVGEGPVVYV